MTYCNNNYLCLNCMLTGYCVYLNSNAVTDKEMQNLDFVNDGLAFGYGLNEEPNGSTLGIQLDRKPAEWKIFIHEAYTGYNGRILGKNGQEQLLATDEFLEVPDASFDLSSEKLSNHFENIRDFYGDYFCEPRVLTNRSNLKDITIERIRICLSILRARYPNEAQFWGLSGRAANDNNPS